MSILKIIQLESGAFKHNDSIDGDFFLGRFSFKEELNKAFLAEAYGAKKRSYAINEIEVYAFEGVAESFTNFTDLENRLVELNYTGIDTNRVVPTSVESISNKTDIVAGNETSSIKYPSVKGLVDWVTSLFVPKTRTITINGTTQDLSENRSFTVGGTAENRQQFTTYGNKYNLSTIGNFYSSEVELGLTPTTINNSPGNNLTGVMATRWVLPLFNSDKSQKLKRFVIRTTDVNFTSLRVVIFMGQTINGSNSRINNLVIHDENITLTGSGDKVAIIERTSFTNDVTIPAGYEVCFLISRLNGTNGTINNFQISGYAS